MVLTFDFRYDNKYVPTYQETGIAISRIHTRIGDYYNTK